MLTKLFIRISLEGEVKEKRPKMLIKSARARPAAVSAPVRLRAGHETAKKWGSIVARRAIYIAPHIYRDGVQGAPLSSEA